MPMTPEERQARLVGRREAKIVWNKAAVDALYAGMADAMIELGGRIIADASARAPRDPATAAAHGVPMMADTGIVRVWAKGKLVHGSGATKASEQKPRGARTPVDQVVLFTGFQSPIAHFNELGTIHQIARPFLTPAVSRNLGGTGGVVLKAMRARARAVR